MLVGAAIWAVKGVNFHDFVKELSSDTGIPVSELIQSVKGGNPEFQGTWDKSSILPLKSILAELPPPDNN